LPEATSEASHASAQPGHLSPITEGSLETESQEDDGNSLDSFLHHADAELNKLIKDTRGDCEEVLAEMPQPRFSERDELSERLPLSMLALPMEDVFITGTPGQLVPETSVSRGHDDNENCEFAVYPPMTVTIPDLPDLQPDDIVVFKVGKNDVRLEVVKRDDDTLTTQQVQEHWGEVQAAMQKELQTWSDHQCFSRRPREGARNFIDTRWVIKFKMEQATTAAVNQIRGGSHLAEPAPVATKTIRAPEKSTSIFRRAAFQCLGRWKASRTSIQPLRSYTAISWAPV
jgi:hypothetical protein